VLSRALAAGMSDELVCECVNVFEGGKGRKAGSGWLNNTLLVYEALSYEALSYYCMMPSATSV
jgi:hypothetical protein